MAPEIFEESGYDEKVDIWAVGVITYILLSGRPPFPGAGGEEVADFQKRVMDSRF
jgi:serine/threonine protein kinase